MLRSGLPLPRAMEELARGRGRIGSAASKASPLVSSDLGSAFVHAGFSAPDVEILLAGEQSGRLEEATKELSAYYAQLAKGRNRILAASAYPIFVLHLGALLLSIPPAILDGGFPEFLKQVASTLGLAYAVVAAVALAWRAASLGFETRPVAEAFIRRIPIVGGLLLSAALARFCLVLSLGIRSAGGVLSSLARAGIASRSALIRQATTRAIPGIREGAGFAEALRESRSFPDDLERAFQVAEASGRLDEEMHRWATLYRERLFERMEGLCAWLPRALYLLVLAVIVYRMFGLLSQVSGIYSSLLDL